MWTLEEGPNQILRAWLQQKSDVRVGCVVWRWNKGKRGERDHGYRSGEGKSAKWSFPLPPIFLYVSVFLSFFFWCLFVFSSMYICLCLLIPNSALGECILIMILVAANRGSFPCEQHCYQSWGGWLCYLHYKQSHITHICQALRAKRLWDWPMKGGAEIHSVPSLMTVLFFCLPTLELPTCTRKCAVVKHERLSRNRRPDRRLGRERQEAKGLDWKTKIRMISMCEVHSLDVPM